MIDLDEIREMFSHIEENAGWDMRAPKLWGYYFTDDDEGKLRATVPLLEQQGYRLVDLFDAAAEEEAGDAGEDGADGYDEDEYDEDEGEGDENDDDAMKGEDEGPRFILHVEKIEAHTPESLHERNRQLSDFAQQQGLASYDGMDVGPAAN